MMHASSPVAEKKKKDGQTLEQGLALHSPGASCSAGSGKTPCIDSAWLQARPEGLCIAQVKSSDGPSYNHEDKNKLGEVRWP